MRIRFETEGGIGDFPGSPARNKPTIIDTDDLPPREIEELDRLPAVSEPPRGAADYFRYTISVTTPERSHIVTLTDPIEDPDVGALVDYLEEKSRE
jgi:hypothetical protein